MSEYAEARFWAKVDRRTADECWPWQGSLTNGYGQFGCKDWKRGQAHRFSYELLVGPIPEGLVIDHLCRNRACVNPAHMEPVTNRENVRRGLLKEDCIYGHKLSGDNLYVDPRGRKHCRECRNRWFRDLRSRKRAKVAHLQKRVGELEEALRSLLAPGGGVYGDTETVDAARAVLEERSE